MATIGELIVSLQGDAKGWASATTEAAKALNALVKEAQKAGQDLSKFNAQNINLLKGWKNELGDTYRTFTDSLEPVKRGLVDQGKALSVTQKGITTLAVNTVVADAKFQQFAKTLNSVSSKLWVVTMGLQQTGRALVASLTIPLAGIATVAVKTFADWEQGTKNLQASADLTEKEAEALTNQFRELALVMPLTVKELQEIAQTAAEAGVSTKNLEGYTIAIAKLVTISKELNLKNAAESLVAVSKAFGITEENVERVGSTIRKMAKEARGGMDDFVSAMLRAVPAAATLNIRFEDMAAMLAAIIPVSGTASRAGTELNTLFDQMSRNLPKLAAQMNITEESLKEMISRDAVATLKEYIEGLKAQGDQVTENQAILEVFGATGAKALRALISQYDVFEQRQVEANQAFKEGTELTKDYEITSNTLMATFKRFGNAVLEVAKVIGDDLNPIIGTLLKKITDLAIMFASFWKALPDGVKKAVVAFAIFLAILGPIILALNTILSIFVGMVTVVAKVATIAATLKAGFAALSGVLGVAGAGFGAFLLVLGKFLLIAGAVVLAVILIYKALDKLFGISEKLKNALGITAFQQRMQEAKDKIKGALGQIDESVNDTVENFKKQAVAMGILATSWGDKVMEQFLYGFREADFGILDDSMRIVESYYKILEEQGKISAEGIYRNTLEARRAIARAIYEVKELGTISEETTKKLEGLVGAARMESIVKEIIAALKVEALEEAIKSINDEIKERRSALKRETRVIDKAIKEREDLYEDQIEEEEKAIKALQKRKKENQRQYKTELRTLEDIVEVAEKEKEIARDRLDAIKESNDLFIENLQEQRDALQENVDETKDTLQELQDLRKDEVDTAEGMLDYAKMNLEAARNQLKKEEALGHDEWDASYRAALQRTSAAEDQVDLAYANYIKTKKLYAKEEKALKEQLEQEKDLVEAKDKEIKQERKNAKTEEKIYEEELDIAEDSLKEARRALESFRDAYQEQSDLLQEEIDEHQERVSDLRDAREEIIGALKKERDAITEKYQNEIDIFEDRLEVAQDSLDATRKLLEAEKGINAQRLQLERERLAAAKELTGGTEFAGVAGGLNLEDFNKKLNEVTENYSKMLDTMEQDTKTKTGTMAGLWEKFKETVKNIDWGQVGKTILALLFPPYGLWIIASEFFKSETWENIRAWVSSTVEKIDWGKIGKAILGLLFPPYGLFMVLTDVFNIDWNKVKEDIASFVTQIDWQKVGRTILGLLFPPYGIYQILTSVFNIDWNKIKDDIANFVAGIDWSLIGKTILGLLFPPYGLFSILTNVFNIDWNKVKNDLATFVGNIDWGLVGRTILGALFAGPIAIGNLGAQIYNSIVSGLQDLGPALQNVGAWIGQTIASGVSIAKDTFKQASNVVYGVVEGLNTRWEEIKNWGKSIGGNIASGVYDAWNNMKDAAKNIVGGIGSGLSDTWNQIKDWGKTTGQQLASGVYDAWWRMYDAVKNIIGGISSGISDKMSDIWSWGKSIGQQVANGVYGAYDAIKSAASWIANVFKNFLGWWSPPKEGPMSEGDKWMPNMMKTLAEGMIKNISQVKGAAGQIGETITGDLSAINPVVNTGVVAGAQPAFQGVAAPAVEATAQGGGVSKQTIINLNPGMMIASKGEVRAFSRMLKQVQDTEGERAGRVEQ